MEANGNVNNQKSSFVATTAVMSDGKSKKKNILKGIFPKKKRSILRKSTSKKVSAILDNLKSLQTINVFFMDDALFLVSSNSLGYPGDP